MESKTYGSADSARQLLKHAASALAHTERRWSTAIGEAHASGMAVAWMAIWAEASVDEAIAAVDNPHDQRTG